MVGYPKNSLQSNMASPLAFSSSLFKSLFMTVRIFKATLKTHYFSLQDASPGQMMLFCLASILFSPAIGQLVQDNRATRLKTSRCQGSQRRLCITSVVAHG